MTQHTTFEHHVLSFLRKREGGNKSAITRTAYKTDLLQFFLGLSENDVMSTDGWDDFIKDDQPLLHGIVKTDRLIVCGGGYAITTEEGIIGGMGVSRGHYSYDMKVAQAGLEAL